MCNNRKWIKQITIQYTQDKEYSHETQVIKEYCHGEKFSYIVKLKMQVAKQDVQYNSMFQIYNIYFSVVVCIASGEKLKPVNLILVPEGVKPMISDQFVNLI